MNVKDDNEKVNYVEVTPENIDEIFDDIKFPKTKADSEEFFKDNERYHDERMVKK